MAKKQSLWGRAKNWISNKVNDIEKSFSKKTSNSNKKSSQKTATKSQSKSTAKRGTTSKVSSSTASKLASRNPQNTSLSMNSVLGKRNTVKTTQKSGVVKKAQEKQRQAKSTKERMDELNAKKNTTQKNTTQKKQSWKDTTVANSTAARRTGMTQTDFEKARKLSDITKGNVNSALAGILKFVTSNTGDPTAGAKEKRDFETESDFRKRAQKNQDMGGKREQISDWASKKIDKNQKLVENAKKDMGKVGKFAADVYGGAIGMGIDAATGPLAPVTMFMRSAGASYNDAKKEGASDEQAYLYGMSTGALEAATEKMSSIAKPLQKLYGKGVADDLTERVLHKMASKASTEGGKNAIYHGGKTFLSAMSEGLEEMVSEGLEPTIANKIYADATGTTHSTSAKDILYAGAVGGVLGGVLGGAGQAVEYSQGKTVQNVYGDDGLKKLLKTAMDSSDEVDAKTATALNEMVDSGKPIAAGQALKVQQAVQKQIQQDSEQMDIADKSAYQIIKNNHFTDVLRKDNDGLVDLSTNTRKIYENAKEDAQEALENDDRMQLKDLQADEITSAVASIRAGVADVSDINLFTTGFSEARTVYEKTTGEKLPKTNKETRTYLTQKNATNKVASAEAETAYFVDTMKGVIQQDITPTYDTNGQAAFEEHIVDSLRVGNPLQVENSVVAFEDYYESGRRGTSFEEINAVDNPAYATLSLDVRKAAYEAGVQDQIQANQSSIDASLEIGKKAEKNASETKTARQRGKLITEFSDVENKKRFTAQEQRVFRSLARTFNINIHITDNVEENGHYVDGEVWMSVDADRSLAYVFAHEITHHMEKFAPQEYQRLKQLVREAWDVREMNEAIERKITQYKNHGKTLTREAALDEILADATYEMLQDESFVESLCIEERSVAQKILDAIQNVIKKLRQILIDAERFTPAQNEALLSQLDILKDAEKLWTDGLMKSVENRDAVGKVENRDAIKKQLNAKFETEVDAWYNNPEEFKKAGGFFKIGTTSEALKSINVKDYDITWDKSKIKKILEDHEEMSIDVIKEVPDVLENPVVVMQSKTRLNSITLFGEVYAEEIPVLVAIQLSPKSKKGKVLNFAKVASAYGKNNVQTMINNSDILYVDANKKRTNNWLSANGLQLPSGLTQYGSIGTVTYYDKVVNEMNKNSLTTMGIAMRKAKGENFSLKDSDGNELSQAQQEYFADSKVRDEEGNLLVMYHGTPNAGFTVFKDGSYFTQNEEYAKEYKEQGASYSGYKQEANDPDVYKVYLNITKPFDTRNEAEREIFENEYYGQWGMGTPLMESGLPDWMDGEDLKEFLEENEYDYDGLILDEGGTGGYEEDVQSRGLSYVVFSPEQVKNVDNVNPTADEDIRFSLKEPVEETKDLIALHNMTASELTKTLELGGLPMPSIAIIKGESGHTEYGDVSLLFSKDTIDPEFVSSNKVYGGDAWTPTYPAIEYKVNENVQKRLSDLYYELANKYGYDDVKPLYNYMQDLESVLNRHKGETNLIKNLSDDAEMMQVYLIASGKGKVEDVKKETVTELPEAEVEMNEYIVKALGREVAESFTTPSGMAPMTHRKAWMKEHKEELEKAYAGYFQEVHGFSDESIKNVLANTEPVTYMKTIRSANLYLKNGPRTVKLETDYEATDAKIREAAGEGYTKWLTELFGGAEEKSGIRNNKDAFTRSGERRSWESLHWENTLENVVKVMKEEENGVGFFGGSGLWGVSAKEYSSIDEIREDSERLERMDEEEYSAIREELGQRFQEIAVSIMDETERNQFIAIDDAMGCIVDAVRVSKTKSGITKELSKYPHLTITETAVNDIVDLVRDIASMPTEYFEAKPMRAVDLSEIVKAVIPSNVSDELKTSLNEHDIEFIEYEAENNEDRIEKVNSVSQEKDIRFSIKEEADISYESLVAKPDMKIVEMSGKNIKQKTRKNIVDEARENVKIHGKTDDLGRLTIKNKDTNNDIVIGAPAIRHGLTRDYETNAMIALHLGEYLNNAIKVNEIESRGINSAGGYILLGYGRNEFGGQYPAYFVIQTLTTGEAELIEFDTLYSINGKKISEAIGGANQGVQSLTSDTISISKLLDIVNGLHSDILPLSVAEYYGNERRETKLGKSVKFSLKDNNEPPVDRFEGVIPPEDDMFDYVNMNETEFVDVPPVRNYEFEKKRVRQQTYDELRKQVESLKNDKRLTKGKVLDVKSVSKPVNEMVRTLMSMSEGTPNRTDFKLEKMIKENMKSIFRNIKNGNIEDAMITAFNVAQETVENLKLVNDTMFEEYKELRDYLKSTRVTLSEEYRSDIADFKEFRKSQQGRLRIVNEGGTSVDNMYMELVERWPELFDANITHPADQLQEIADVRETLEPYDVMLSAEETEQLIKVTAEDILDITALGKPWKSFADKKKEYYDYYIKSLKQKHKEAVRDIQKKERERYEEKLNKEKDKAKEKEQQIKDKVSERYEKKLEREKEKVKEERWVGNERVEAERMRGAQAVQKEKDKAKTKKENQRHKEFVKKMEKEMKWLSDRLLKPTDDKHLPEGYQKAIAELLCSIDTQSERSRQLEAKFGISKSRMDYLWLKEQYEQIVQESEDMILDEEISKNLKELAKTMKGRLVSDMTSEELEKLYRILRGITHGIRNINNAFTEGINATIEEMANDTLEVAAGRKKYVERSGLLGAKDTLLNESMVTPRDFFEHLGGGMETAFMGIRKGFDKHVDNITVARDFFDGLFRPFHNKTKFRKNAKPGSRIEDWRDSTTAQEFELENGGTITLNIAQRMTLYCMMKRQQAQSHIFGSGIVASQLDLSSNIKKFFGAKVDVQHLAAQVTLNDVTDIISTLTDEQIQVADQMQDFLNNECSEWGNEASMRMYGYKKFTETDYFPIKSSDAYLDKSFKGRESTERIRNFGFTKGTVVNADNPIMIDDIFTVFADHVNKMSLYNSFAAPIADMTRLYNYKTRDENGNVVASVDAALDNAYGSKTGRYINNFMADLQSNTQTRTDGFTRLANKGLANYKKSAIGFNLRVAVQQPTAIMRAFVLMSPKYFVNTNINMKKNIQDMKDHCQIARWKSWGFSQVDMARDLDDIMMNNEWSKLDLVTMEIYGALDTATWSTIWAAVRKEVKDKHPDVTIDSDEFYELCNERASEVFDKTQVVDSVLHRSQVMRNTDTLSKILTGFMAEPTRTFNMMRSQYADAKELWQSGEKGKATAKVMHATNVYVANAMACAMAAAIADMLRGRDVDDDDEPDDWWANTLSNFKDGVNPLNMIPVLKEIPTFWEGWDGSNMALEGLEKLVKASKAIADKLNGESDKAWKDLFTAEAEAIGYVSGLPVKNVLREMKIFAEKLGIDVFASTGESDKEVKEQKKDKKLLDIDIDVKKLLGGVWGWISADSGDGASAVAKRSGVSKEDYEKQDGILGDIGEAIGDKLEKFDKFLKKHGYHLNDEEQAAWDRKKFIAQIKEDTKDMNSLDAEDYIWEAVTKGYTSYIKDGDFKEIDNMRDLLTELDEDLVEGFDESVLSKTIARYKRTLGTEVSGDVYKQYIQEQYGYSDAEFSANVLVKSKTAEKFQKAAVEGNDDEAVDALAILIAEGLTYGDSNALWEKRYNVVDMEDYVTHEFVCPVTGTVTSSFGYRSAPTAGASTYHEGIDIAAPAGTAVCAADGGKVTKAGWSDAKGWHVVILHGSGRYTEYAHLNEYYFQKGEYIQAGQQLGTVGSTGISTGPHLDFRVKENGNYVDPAPYLGL